MFMAAQISQNPVSKQIYIAFVRADAQWKIVQKRKENKA